MAWIEGCAKPPGCESRGAGLGDVGAGRRLRGPPGSGTGGGGSSARSPASSRAHGPRRPGLERCQPRKSPLPAPGRLWAPGSGLAGATGRRAGRAGSPDPGGAGPCHRPPPLGDRSGASAPGSVQAGECRARPARRGQQLGVDRDWVSVSARSQISAWCGIPPCLPTLPWLFPYSVLASARLMTSGLPQKLFQCAEESSWPRIALLPPDLLILNRPPVYGGKTAS